MWHFALWLAYLIDSSKVIKVGSKQQPYEMWWAGISLAASPPWITCRLCPWGNMAHPASYAGYYTSSFGTLITIKSSLTSDVFQKYASMHHSSFVMPAWGLLQWKMTWKTLTRFELVCLLIKQATAKCWCHNEKLSPLCYQLNFLHAVTKFLNISYAQKNLK